MTKPAALTQRAFVPGDENLRQGQMHFPSYLLFPRS